MKTYALILVHLICACTLFTLACNSKPANAKLKGNWKSKDGITTLKITDKQFSLDNEAPVAEDYFLKKDTILTSFEGNQPYTRFVIQKLDEHNLHLLFPDSITVEFVR